MAKFKYRPEFTYKALLERKKGLIKEANVKCIYKLEVSNDLLPNSCALGVWVCGQKYYCDPHYILNPNQKPKFTVWQALRKLAEYKRDCQGVNFGICFLGSNPNYDKSVRFFLNVNKFANVGLYTDGTDHALYGWANHVDCVNLIVRHSTEVFDLGVYYEWMLHKMDKLSHIKNKRLIVRYIPETQEELCETASILQNIKPEWEVCINEAKIMEEFD